jgi:hypothetical protein
MKPGYCFIVILLALVNAASVSIFIFCHWSIIYLIIGGLADIILLIIGITCWKSDKIIRYPRALEQIWIDIQAQNLSESDKSRLREDIDRIISKFTTQSEIDWTLDSIIRRCVSLGVLRCEDRSLETVQNFIRYDIQYDLY